MSAKEDRTCPVPFLIADSFVKLGSLDLTEFSELHYYLSWMPNLQHRCSRWYSLTSLLTLCSTAVTTESHDPCYLRNYSGRCRQLEQRDSWVWVEIDGYSYTVTIDQEFPQTLDAVKSQSLKIELPRAKSGARWQWADRKTGMLEDRLPEILEGLAARATEDREHTAVEAREAAERQRAREKAKTDAQSKALQHFDTETLYQQVSAFERARAISAYCDAIEEQIAAANPATPELEPAVEWLEWARRHAAEIDPLQTLPTMPTAPVFTAEQLAPHLNDAESSVPQRK